MSRENVFVFGVAMLLIGMLAGAVTMEIYSQEVAEAEDPVVLFRSDGLYNRTIAFYSPGQATGIVCSVDRRDEWQIGRQSYKYVNSTQCSEAQRDLVEEWNDPEVKDFNVYQRGREYIENKSSNSSESS